MSPGIYLMQFTEIYEARYICDTENIKPEEYMRSERESVPVNTQACFDKNLIDIDRQI